MSEKAFRWEVGALSVAPLCDSKAIWKPKVMSFAAILINGYCAFGRNDVLLQPQNQNKYN